MKYIYFLQLNLPQLYNDKSQPYLFNIHFSMYSSVIMTGHKLEFYILTVQSIKWLHFLHY